MINATASAAATGTTAPKAATPLAGGNLGKDQFLKLLTTQLQHQDPMNPTDDMSFIGQMAQFSSLEQTTNMAQALDKYGSAQQLAQSIGLIGRTVAGQDDEGNAVNGVVDAVTITDSAATLSVGGTPVLPSTVTAVK